MAEQLVRVQIHAAVITVAIVEMAVDHQHLRLLEVAQRLLAPFLDPVHHHLSCASSLMYTARPPTIVAATPPRSVQPSNGVFFDFDRIAAAATLTFMSGASTEMS